jgi:hypothetical protein
MKVEQEVKTRVRDFEEIFGHRPSKIFISKENWAILIFELLARNKYRSHTLNRNRDKVTKRGDSYDGIDVRVIDGIKNQIIVF